MTDAMSPFRELDGIGPATESRLHQAGIWAWSDLAEVLQALGGIRGLTIEAFRQLAKVAEARSDEEGRGPDTAGGERTETFLVRLALGPDGAVLRSSLTQVRNQQEQSWSTWSPEELVRSITAWAGVRDEPPDEGDGRTTTDERGGATDGDAPVPAVAEPHGRVIVDGGVVTGGHQDEMEIVLTPSDGGLRSGSFRYHADLEARPYGTSRWMPTGNAVVGVGSSTVDTVIRFEHVELSHQLHRVRATLTLSPA